MIQNRTREAAIDVSAQHLKKKMSSYIQVSDPAQGIRNAELRKSITRVQWEDQNTNASYWCSTRLFFESSSDQPEKSFHCGRHHEYYQEEYTIREAY